MHDKELRWGAGEGASAGRQQEEGPVCRVTLQLPHRSSTVSDVHGTDTERGHRPRGGQVWPMGWAAPWLFLPVELVGAVPALGPISCNSVTPLLLMNSWSEPPGAPPLSSGAEEIMHEPPRTVSCPLSTPKDEKCPETGAGESPRPCGRRDAALQAGSIPPSRQLPADPSTQPGQTREGCPGSSCLHLWWGRGALQAWVSVSSSAGNPPRLENDRAQLPKTTQCHTCTSQM